MAVDTASDILAFKKQGTGNNLNTWGDELNNALDRISEAIADRTEKSLTGSVTLTSTNYEANESRSAVLVFSDGGLSSTPTVTLPARKKLYWAKNTGSTYAVTIGVSGGTSASIPTGGRWVLILCDGTDCEIHDPSVSDLKAPSAALDMNSQKITSLADPTANQDAATKAYVDTEVADVVSDAGAAAAASAAAAATSASNASTSETNAASSASAASTSATNAANSATAAASSATAAATSATEAADSAASAGSKVSGPSSATDNAVALYDGTTGKLIQDGPTIGAGANQLVQRDGSGRLTGDGSVLTGIGLSQVSQTTVSTPVTSIEFTSLPTTDHLMISVKDASHDRGSNDSLRLFISTDGGSTYQGDVVVSPSYSNSTLYDGAIIIFGFQNDVGMVTSGVGGGASDPGLILNTSTGRFSWVATGGIDAVKLEFGESSADAGTFTLYGF